MAPRPKSARSLALCALLLAPWSALQDGPVSGLPPDVLIVVADDMSWPELEDAYTPALDALAAEGVTLTSFYGMPVCSPARHALLHGRWPRRSAMGKNVNSYAPPSEQNATPSADLVSLPKILASRGYHTALVGKWHLGQAPAAEGADPMLDAPRAHGFQRWLAGTPANLRAGEGLSYRKWVRVDDGAQRIEHDYATLVMRDAALQWWSETPSPKFLLVALAAPHQPLSTPEAAVLPEGYEVGPSSNERFLAMIASIDHVVGRLREAADRSRTLFCFLSDNGTAPIVYGVKRGDGKGTTRERGIRVPFVAAGPNLARGARSAAPVSIVDLMATIAEATGSPLAGDAGAERPPGGEDSVSFLGALQRPDAWQPARPWVFAEKYDAEGDDVALRAGRWKLRRLDGKEFLIDLERDPEEERPLSAAGELDEEQRAALQTLRGYLEREVPPRQG